MTRSQFFRIYNRFSELRAKPKPPTYHQLESLAKLIGSVARKPMYVYARHTTVPRNKPPYRVH